MASDRHFALELTGSDETEFPSLGKASACWFTITKVNIRWI